MTFLSESRLEREGHFSGFGSSCGRCFRQCSLNSANKGQLEGSNTEVLSPTLSVGVELQMLKNPLDQSLLPKF